MFVYCTEVLRLSEAEAYLRITVARASREYPVLLDMLADGRLHLTGIARLAPHLTTGNQAELLGRATHQTRRQIEELIAEIAPLPDAPALIRKLPGTRGLPAAAVPVGTGEPELALPQLCPDRVGMGSPGPGGPSGDLAFVGSPESNRQSAAAVVWQRTPGQPLIEPLGPARYKVQFTASAELQHKLERLRALMRSQVPDGDLAVIIDRAVTEKLERLESRRFAKTTRPRNKLSESDTSPCSRHIPAAIRRAVYERDGSRCRYVDAAGRRCSERDRLEFHHRQPFGMGGDHNPANICLVCRAHNTLLAEHDYGREAAARVSRSRSLPPTTALAAPAQRPVNPTGAPP